MSYSMSLNSLLAVLAIHSDDQSEISSLVIDSRNVSQGCMFFAYPGVSLDGRDFMLAAQAAGASAIVCEADGFELSSDITIPVFAVSGLQSKVGVVANVFYKQPSQSMQVFGVTGTNGKTTCCYLLTQALTALGVKAAMVGTIGTGTLGTGTIGTGTFDEMQADELQAATHTTPGPIAIHRLLAEFRDQGITQVCMEVSSHALDQGRVSGVQFFCTLFTNLTHDHLDYHGDMAAYAAAKQGLFTNFASELAIINVNDELGRQLIDVTDSQFVVRYGQGGDVYAEDIELRADGIEMVIEGNGVEFELRTPLIGKVNIPNIELLVATLLGLSTSIEDIQNILSNLIPAPGRMELFTAVNKPQVVVDYAHTPDALEKALLSIKEHCQGDLWCVFGAGGDRDQLKRPLMGAAAEKYAQKLIVTNDNPRSESPSLIAEQICAGIAGDVELVLDRGEAIQRSIELAQADDWVLIAGKGHESTQEMGDQVLPFSDRKHVTAALGVAA